MTRTSLRPARFLRSEGRWDGLSSSPSASSPGLMAAHPGALAQPSGAPAAPAAKYEFNDSHFHLTNYIQEGITPRQFLKIMGTRVGRSTLFGIPLQQQWSYRISGDMAPTYYLDTDARLYYYSFTDAHIAMAYRSLTPRREQARFDPMITGFNPTDMYAADHIRRVLPDISRGVLRHRRVHDPQGVRLLQDRGRRREPHRSGARPDARLRRRGRAGGPDPQRRGSPVPQARATPPAFLAQLKDCSGGTRRTRIIWAHTGRRPGRPARSRTTSR